MVFHKIFKNISNFSNVNDYLPILNGCINADLIILFLLFHGIFNSFYLKKWYKKYQLSAVIADVLILFIGIILARFFYKYFFNEFSIWKFTFLAVCIQITHDILFYLLFKNSPIGYNAMLDFFKDYAKEVGIGAVFGDSLMMIITCLLSSYFATLNTNSNIITLIVSLYFFPYMINYE
uniref:Uncharacterized protein n=1 Tax=viral metagenome TaxID=1070528 RepID=A0A6C0EPH3_9ZZZZ